MSKYSTVKIAPCAPSFKAEYPVSNIERFVSAVIRNANMNILVKQFEENLRPKVREKVSLRLEPDVHKYYRAMGKGYQTAINAALRAVMEALENRAYSLE